MEIIYKYVYTVICLYKSVILSLLVKLPSDLPDNHSWWESYQPALWPS